MKQGITEIFLSWLKTQGTITVLLVGISFYFWNDNQEIKKDQEKCSDEVRELHIYIRDKLSDVVEDNTSEMQSFDNTIKNYFYAASYRNGTPAAPPAN